MIPERFKIEIFVSGKNDRREQSCRLFERAGHTYQRAECWGKAGTSFEKAANIYHEITEREIDAASNFQEAAVCFKNTNNCRSLELFEKSIDLYFSVGRRTLAAQQLEKVADMYETHEKLPTKAMEAYRKAGDLYEQEESSSTAFRCYLKVAHLAVEVKEFELAFKYFTNVGEKAVNNSLLQFGAKEYFLKAVLTALVIDHVRAKNELQTFTKNYRDIFGQSREQVFCEKAIQFAAKGSLAEFHDCVKNFNRYSPFDQWGKALIDKIQSTIELTSEKLSTNRSSTAFLGRTKKTTRNVVTVKEEKPSFDEDNLF